MAEPVTISSGGFGWLPAPHSGTFCCSKHSSCSAPRVCFHPWSRLETSAHRPCSQAGKGPFILWPQHLDLLLWPEEQEGVFWPTKASVTTCISRALSKGSACRAHCVSGQRDPFFDEVLRLETRVASRKPQSQDALNSAVWPRAQFSTLLSSPSSYKVNLSPLHSGCESIVLSMESVWEECCLHWCPLLEMLAVWRGALGEVLLRTLSKVISARAWEQRRWLLAVSRSSAGSDVQRLHAGPPPSSVSPQAWAASHALTWLLLLT